MRGEGKATQGVRRLVLLHFDKYTPKESPDRNYEWPRELTVKGMAEQLAFPKVTAYNWINRLKREGLIVKGGRGRSGNDRHTGVVFIITMKGRVEAAKEHEIIIQRG